MQYQEEVTHAMKFFDYLCEQGARMELQAIDKPPANFKSPLAVFEQSFKHEQFVTKNIYALVDLAIKEGDHANSFLKWYVDEQVEERPTLTRSSRESSSPAPARGPCSTLTRNSASGRPED